MRKITDVIQKPSQAVEAMILGLEQQSTRPDFVVDMHTYGSPCATQALDNMGVKYPKTYDLCFGCAATCTVQYLAGKNLTQSDIVGTVSRAETLQFDEESFDYFEVVIDDFRGGKIYPLFEYFDKELGLVKPYVEVINSWLQSNGAWYLDSKNWRTELPKVKEFLQFLKENDL